MQRKNLTNKILLCTKNSNIGKNGFFYCKMIIKKHIVFNINTCTNSPLIGKWVP